MGGHSHASLDELWSAKMLEAVSNESIVGSFSRIELNNKINPSFADVSITLNSFQEGLTGEAATKNTKELFEKTDISGAYIVPFQVSHPNFITNKKITAASVVLHSNSEGVSVSLKNKIVVIEGVK